MFTAPGFRPMFRSLLPLTPLAPVVAIIAFAAANAAAEGRGSAEQASRPANEIRDVQVGEQGRLMRIAILCREDCRVGARAGGAFFLPGVETSLEIDLAGRARLARALSFEAGAGGSTLTIDAPGDVAKASIKRCAVNAGAAACIDIEFVDEPAPTDAPRLAAPETPREKPRGKPQSAEQEVATPAPALRDAPDEPRLIFARFAPPERLDPPSRPAGDGGRSGGATRPSEASLAPTRRAAPGGPVILTDRAAVLAGGEFDIAAAAAEILHRSFGVAECEGARARLRTDAWALEAMVDVGFCDAIAGRLEAADGVFTRLLAYTPDNYEALVGRALIAAKAGERSVARRYFQDALNALPPIAESDRIVEAMADL